MGNGVGATEHFESVCMLGKGGKNGKMVKMQDVSCGGTRPKDGSQSEISDTHQWRIHYLDTQQSSSWDMSSSQIS